MTIIKWRNRPLSSSWIDEAFRNSFLTGFEKTFGYTPYANILENDQEFHIKIFVPGLSKSDVKIQAENAILTVSYEKKEADNEKSENYLHREFELESFTRSFTLPQTADKDNIKATFENGVLHIAVPKKENARLSRTIEIS
ncbi:MAG TPA: hypothetical protein DCM62_04455 [Bacteroidales bacterium]|nr:hypothetical protein [Bacteroidales bacterium]